MFFPLVCTLIFGLAAGASTVSKSESHSSAVDELKLRLLDRLLSELAAAEQLDADSVCGLLKPQTVL